MPDLKAGDWVCQTWQDDASHNLTRAVFQLKAVSDGGVATMNLPGKEAEYTCRASDLRAATEEEAKKAQTPA